MIQDSSLHGTFCRTLKGISWVGLWDRWDRLVGNFPYCTVAQKTFPRLCLTVVVGGGELEEGGKGPRAEPQ